MSCRKQSCKAQYFPLFYPTDMDDFAMTYKHFYECSRNVEKF